MAKHASRPVPQTELIPATREQEPILANLLELYIHDFSEFCNIEIGPDGRYGYSHLSLYWSEPDRHPFLIKIDGNLAGFVFVKKTSDLPGKETVWDMAEFFVMRRYRRRGIGISIAHEVWRLFPGQWQIRVMESNVPAHDFWTRAISKFTGEQRNPIPIDRDGQHWHLFSFESRPGISS